jgi:putative ABC transport system permease protein
MTVLADIKYALRVMRNEWRFTLILIGTLGTGIAASGVIFNVVNATLLRPLPIEDEARVFRLRDYTQNTGGQRVMRSNRIPNFLSIREEARSFGSVVGMYRAEWSLVAGELAIPAKVILMSPGSLQLTGARVHAGRLFTADEEASGLDANVIVLSHSFWQQHFGGRHDVIGSTVRVENRMATVVGVLTPGFRFPYDGEAWMPERFSPASEGSLAVFARLAPSVSKEQAEAELDAIAVRAEAARPAANRGIRFAMMPVREDLAENQSRLTMALMAAAGLLLLLASANVANLLLVRGVRRSREIAVRSALGAERGRQIRQMLIESLVFAALGTVVGLAVAAPLSEAVVGLVPNTLRDQLGMTETIVDWRAALFAAAVSSGVGVIAGLAPALRLSRTDITATLRQQSRGVAGGHLLMRALVVGEVALASVLLICAGLMINNFQRLLDAELGLEPDQLLSIRMPLPPRYDTPERRIVLTRQLIDAAAALPGTARAGLVTVNPLDRGSFGAAIEAEDQPLAPGQGAPIVNHRLVTAEWLRTAGVRLISGRHFDGTDTATSMPVAIVSNRMASRLWPSSNALGKRIRQPRPNAPWITVIGVVADVRDTGEWKETWYVPYEQHAGTLAGGTVHVMLRSRIEAAAALSAMREAVHTIDPLLPVPEPSIMTTMWAASQTPQRMGAVTAALFALSGLLLAALGTYGVVTYLVSARAREFGIRQALGATPLKVHALVMRDGAALVAGGLTLGGILSLGAVQALRSVTTEAPGMPPALPWIIALVLLAAAAAATFVPARRATRMSPVDVMRSE